jgi:hypothetical protein
MNKNTFPNPIYRYFFMAYCLFFSFNQTAFATNNCAHFTLKNHSIRAIALDSINLDTLLMDFNAAIKLTDSLAKAQIFQKLGTRAYEDYPVYALRFLDSAQVYFKQLNNSQGVAVCYVDKARVFQQQGTLDSCVQYLSKAKKMWITFESPSRVFNINNDLLKVYMGYKATNNVNAIIAENDALYLADSKKDIYWRDIETFLTLCVEYYDKNNDKGRSGLFQMKKKKYLESIKNK